MTTSVPSAGNHSQTHDGARIAANQFDHVIQLLADDIHHLAVCALTNADDLVFFFQLAVLVGGTARYHFRHDCLSVAILQLSADTFELQSQGNAEIVQGRG